MPGEPLELEEALGRERVRREEFGQLVDLSGTERDVDEGEAAVTLRPERGEAKRIPLAAVKEARLAFRFS